MYLFPMYLNWWRHTLSEAEKNPDIIFKSDFSSKMSDSNIRLLTLLKWRSPSAQQMKICSNMWTEHLEKTETDTLRTVCLVRYNINKSKFCVWGEILPSDMLLSTCKRPMRRLLISAWSSLSQRRREELPRAETGWFWGGQNVLVRQKQTNISSCLWIES